MVLYLPHQITNNMNTYEQLCQTITTGIDRDSRDLEGWVAELAAYRTAYWDLVRKAETPGLGLEHLLLDAEDLLDDIEWIKDRIEGITNNG